MEILEILTLIKRKMWLIVIITVISTIISALISIFFLTPSYQADISLYVSKQAGNIESSVVYSDIMVSTQLVKDYREFAKSRLVTSTVIERMNLGKITATQMAKKIGVHLKNDTRIIQITVEDTSPYMARDIANKVGDVFQEKVIELMDVQNVQIIDRAQTPQNPFKPNIRLNIAIATFVGLMISILLALSLEYFNNKINTSDDIKKMFDIPVIGSIPVFPKVIKPPQSRIKNFVRKIIMYFQLRIKKRK